MISYILLKEDVILGSGGVFQTGYPYRELGIQMMKNNIQLKEGKLFAIVLIEEEAFYNCTALRSVVFPDLEVLKREAFFGCSNLKSVVFPKSVKSLGEGAFGDCKRLQTVIFEDCLCRELPEQIFSNNRGLEQVLLPSGLEQIGSQAFVKCEKLREINLPSELHKIGKEAFMQSGLEQLILPEQLQVIEESAFLKCRNIEYVKIPESVQKIGRWAFHGCKNMKVLEISHDPKNLGSWICNKNCILRCRKGSRTEAYARKFGMKVEYI